MRSDALSVFIEDPHSRELKSVSGRPELFLSYRGVETNPRRALFTELHRGNSDQATPSTNAHTTAVHLTMPGRTEAVAAARLPLPKR